MPEPYCNKYGEILPYDSFENEPTGPGLLLEAFMNPQTIAAFAAGSPSCR